LRRVVSRWAGAAILAALLAFALAPFALYAASDGGAAPPPGVAALAPAAPPSSTVRIVFTIVPNTKKAMVFWGKKRLGIIAPHAPLIVTRPRDSGPLDVVVKSDGYVTVQTRAYTFADSKISVKLTKLEEKNTLLGYREELPPDGGVPPGGGPDGGMP
jgi:apolipoprotein N-acyltransferase